MVQSVEYDPRYLQGIIEFNRHDFFEAHEVWEDLWRDADPADRAFVQGLIQAAVAVYHQGRGNARGARRLFHSGREYMNRYAPRYWGLDIVDFWMQMENCLRPALNEGLAEVRPPPLITLDPSPIHWPDPNHD